MFQGYSLYNYVHYLLSVTHRLSVDYSEQADYNSQSFKSSSNVTLNTMSGDFISLSTKPPKGSFTLDLTGFHMNFISENRLCDDACLLFPYLAVHIQYAFLLLPNSHLYLNSGKGLEAICWIACENMHYEMKRYKMREKQWEIFMVLCDTLFWQTSFYYSIEHENVLIL